MKDCLYVYVILIREVNMSLCYVMLYILGMVIYEVFFFYNFKKWEYEIGLGKFIWDFDIIFLYICNLVEYGGKCIW